MKRFFILVFILLAGCSSNSFFNKKTINNNVVQDNTATSTFFKEHVIFSNKNKVSIAVILPLEGQYKDISDNIVNAIQLAYNNNNNKNVILRFYSTFSNGKDVTYNATKEAVSDGADIIVGPLFSNNLGQVYKITSKKNIPVISLSNDRTYLVNTNNIYIMGYSPEIEVERIVDYVANTQNAVRFVAMVPENKYGNVVLSALKASLEARGLSLVRVVTYPADTINFSPYIEKLVDPEELNIYLQKIKEYNLKNANSTRLVQTINYPELNIDFDTLFVGDTGSRLMLLGVHLPYMGIETNKINFIGTRLLGNTNLSNERVFHSVVFPDFINLDNTIFASKFCSIFKTKPTLVSVAAYDAIQMIMNQVKINEETGIVSYDFSVENLTNQHNLGVLGNFKLRKDGLTKRDMDVKGVSSNGFTVIDNTLNHNFMSVENYKDIPIESIPKT